MNALDCCQKLLTLYTRTIFSFSSALYKTKLYPVLIDFARVK